jgi:hypothetical protein
MNRKWMSWMLAGLFVSTTTALAADDKMDHSMHQSAATSTMDHSTMDHSTMDHSTMDHSKMDRSTMTDTTATDGITVEQRADIYTPVDDMATVPGTMATDASVGDEPADLVTVQPAIEPMTVETTETDFQGVMTLHRADGSVTTVMADGSRITVDRETWERRIQNGGTLVGFVSEREAMVGGQLDLAQASPDVPPDLARVEMDVIPVQDEDIGLQRLEGQEGIL